MRKFVGLALVLAAVATAVGDAATMRATDGPYLSVGFLTTCALKVNSRITCWGHDQYHRVSQPNASRDSFSAISDGGYIICGLKTDGHLRCWGSNGNGERSGPNASIDSFRGVAAGSYLTCGLTSDDHLRCWGMDGPNASTDTFSAVSAGFHICGLRTDGHLRCWGNDDFGQISGPNSSTEKFSAVSAGYARTCAVKLDAHLACWGLDESGSVSGPNASMDTFGAVSTATHHTCGLKLDGHLACWGYESNHNGMVSGPNSSTDVFSAVSAGVLHTCGLKLDGHLACWGLDNYGEVSGPNASGDSFGFNPLAPLISSFTPASGITGSKVSIEGTNFATATKVRFNGAKANFKIVSDAEIQATVPNGGVTGRIDVTNTSGAAGSADDYVVTFSIVNLSPTSGPVGTPVTLTGVGFGDVTAVKFNGVSASFQILSPTSIRTTVPFGATTGKVTATSPAGIVTGSKSTKFTVTAL
jgi:alpha-tubulin suppressor-like RCC1 family protein